MGFSVAETGGLILPPRRERGSGNPAGAVGSPAAVSSTAAAAGAQDKGEISDDGNAGMAHLGQINKASRTSMIF
jgi:hypothetical protein